MKNAFNVKFYETLEKPQHTSKPSLIIIYYYYFLFSSYLELGAGAADLVDIGQRAAVVRRTGLRQTELLNLLELHLKATSKHTHVSKGAIAWKFI